MKKNNVVQLHEYRALKEISAHFEIDFESLRRENVTFNPDWEDHVEFDFEPIDWDNIEDETE
jgi:hypothetical protein